MNRLYTSGDFSSSCSSDTDDGSSSEDEGTANIFRDKRTTEKNDTSVSLRKSTSQNIILKLQNREVRRIIKPFINKKIDNDPRSKYNINTIH